ncbi:MAG: fibronectin type III-like domain-contianing protein, partial [Oscillospiraceae bacterium]|nr:fibronectin type III-like domain-contianing protein [Oscillospiraceae bacterium]
SYTEFAWSEFEMTESADQFTVEVTVTNVGDAAGKETVQIYLQKPYTQYDKDNQLEKAAVELVGYEKTSLLSAGESQTVTVTVDQEWMKSYDTYGYGTYIVEAGEYYLAAGKDAHDAVNHILAAKGKETGGDAAMAAVYEQESLDTTTYATAETGQAITNQLADTDIRAYDEEFVYLSRSDWTGTWPQVYADGQWEAPEELLDALEIIITEDSSAVMPEFSVISEEYGELKLVEEDPKGFIRSTIAPV